MIKDSGLEIIAIILTHGHYDHTGAVAEFNLPVFIHKQDEFLLKKANGWLPQGINDPAVFERLQFLTEGQEIIFGNSNVKVIHTPGHSPGSISLLAEDLLISGDTLFAHGVGRTDLPGGSFAEINESLEKKILKLDDDIVVFPGHGPKTTIVLEKEGNFSA